jgi:hypothetical protein
MCVLIVIGMVILLDLFSHYKAPSVRKFEKNVLTCKKIMTVRSPFVTLTLQEIRNSVQYLEADQPLMSAVLS